MAGLENGADMKTIRGTSDLATALATMFSTRQF